MAGIADALQPHGRIGFDTSIFIYQLEGSSRYAASCSTVFDRLAQGTFEGVTSVLTLIELTVRPLQLGRFDAAREYEAALSSFPHLTIVDLDRSSARIAAQMRAAHRLRPADALQVAACLQAGATAFLSNDAGLRRLTEIEVLLLDTFSSD